MLIIISLLIIGKNISNRDQRTEPETTAIRTLRKEGQTRHKTADKKITSTKKITQSSLTGEIISSISSQHEKHRVYEDLSRLLMDEIRQIKTAKDIDVISARIKPIVHKFYLLNRVSNELPEGSPIVLSGDLRPQIEEINALWNQNRVLGAAVDTLFSQFDLLTHEHVPYQLREQLSAN